MDFVSTHEYPDKSSSHDQFFKLLNDLSSTVKKIDPSWNIHITAYGVSLGGYGEIGDHDTSNNAAGFITFASQFQMLDSNQFGIMSFTGNNSRDTLIKCHNFFCTPINTLHNEMGCTETVITNILLFFCYNCRVF